ncbi:CMRF35-like molecule 7 isoform X2 [Vicugna pacos]|uniref:CMRF35-like molecule 7 isoform X2 n=1 Tax=Vicugna pacos TaxID=30538 RepID=A0ABM5BIG0_VICPA
MLKGYFSIQGPESVQGVEQGSVTIQCRYDPGWETYRKWWCRGERWELCRILVQTKGSEQEVKKDRVSIRDDQKGRVLMVTMLELRQNDTDTYWCGIEKTGTDLGAKIKVTIVPERAVLSTSESLPSGTMANSIMAMSSVSYIRTHYMLLAFVKVPILLVLVGINLWLKGSQRDPEEQRGQPIYVNLSSGPLNLTLMDEQKLPAPDPLSRGDTGRGRNTSERSGCGDCGWGPWRLARHLPCPAQLEDSAQGPSDASLPAGVPAPRFHFFG